MTQLPAHLQKQLVDMATEISGAGAAPKAQGGGGGVETRYRGASRFLRSMVSWIPGLRSPDADLPNNEREILIARSRDAMRNHLLARAAIGRMRTSVVGTGLVCYAQVDAKYLGITPEQGQELDTQLNRIWEMYALDPRECDAESGLNHYQLQALVLLSALVSGDVLIATPYIERTGAIFGTRLQLIEADRVSNPGDGLDTEYLVDGVEFDRDGSPLFYHVASSYRIGRAFSAQRKWEKLPAFGSETGRRRTLHVMCDKERPGQKRGAPWLAPVLEPLQKLERYSSAELMAAVLSAFFTVFIEKGENYQDGVLPMNMMGSDDPSTTDHSDDTIKLGEGAIVDLGVGEKATVANPARPNAQFDPFFVSVVKQIGAALQVPMEELLLHYDSSYSAARAAMLQAWRYYSERRWWLTSQFCQPSRDLIIDEAVARGMIDLPGYSDPFKRRAYLNALWIGPARGAINELHEAKAARERIDIGISNEAIETAAMSGEPWGDIYAQRLLEINQRKKDGTYTPPKGSATAQEQLEEQT